jgi:hypothetical protein
MSSLMPTETLNRLIRQFLVHSYLYYRLDESLISDQQYDELAQKLRKSLTPSEADANLTFKEYLGSINSAEASGYSIRQYPAEIISSALHLLYQNRFKNLMSFSTFLARYGYRTKTELLP